MEENKINVYYNRLENLDTLIIKCTGKHIKSWRDLVIKLGDKDIKKEYDEFEYYVDCNKSFIKLTNNEKMFCDVITTEIKYLILGNKYFSLVSKNTPLLIDLYNSKGEEIKYHNITKLDFKVKNNGDVGVWNIKLI